MYTRLLIFVLTGLTFLSASARATPDRPVIFVHGIVANATAWGRLTNVLAFPTGFGGCPTYSPLLGQVYNSCAANQVLLPGKYYRAQFSDNQMLTLDVQGEQLAAIVDEVLALNLTDSVYIVAHSMGGLAARNYIQRLDGTKVARLITVGTPNLGAEWAAFCGSPAGQFVCTSIGVLPDSVAVAELTPGSDALNEINDLATNPLPAGTTFISILGTGRPVIAEDLEDGDGIVTITSQNLASVPAFVGTHFEYTSAIAGCGAISIPQTHTCETNDPGVWTDVVRFIESAIFAGDFEEGTPVAWMPSDEVSRQPGPEAADVWITSVFDYDDDYGVNDDRLMVGGWADFYRSLIVFDLDGLPVNAASAQLRMYVRHNPGQSMFVPMELRRVTSSWDEEAGWPNRPDSVFVRNLPAPVIEGWYYIDITDLYIGWKAGTFENRGIELRPAANNNRFNVFISSDYPTIPSRRPKLVVVTAD